MKTLEIRYSEELRDYITQTGKTIIVVDVAKTDGDFEFAELHLHFTSQRQAELFRSRRNFRPVKTELGEVLLPDFPLEYAPTVTFGFKKFLFWRVLTQTGIKL